MTSRRSSGSIRADKAVEPTRSENITVTWRRSAVSRGATGEAEAGFDVTFDAENEPLLNEYKALFNIMQAPPANAQYSDTPFRDVVELGSDIDRAMNLDAASAEVAGRISLGVFFAETNGQQNVGNARSNKYKGSLQTGISEDQNGQKKLAAIKNSIAALDPPLSARDAKEEARVGKLNHRLNHWTAVRDGLMNAHAGLFRHIPDIVRALPNPIDQLKL
jgi:hypothetical protein